MLRHTIVLLCLATFLASAAPSGCVGSSAVTSFRLYVQPAGTGQTRIPIHNVNNIPNGYRIGYQPLDLPANMGKDAKLTLVMVPNSADGQVTVLEPRLMASSTEWTAPFAARIVLVVFAPQGLDEKRLTNLVTKDDGIVAALADYADQTAELEASLELAKELEDQADDDVSRPQRPSTPEQQAIFALVRALNPAVSSYDPLGTGRRAGPTTLTGKGMTTFFDNAGGLFPGSGALSMVKQWLMPDTEFRSVYGQTGESDGMTLCAQSGPRSKNKLAYIWAYRVTNAAAPATSILKDVDVPIGLRVSVPIKLDKTADWRLLDKVFDWTFVSDNASIPRLHPAVRPAPEDRTLLVDLRKFAGPPGSYRIEGKWDWGTFNVNGKVTLHRLDDLKAAQVSPDSQPKLVTATGPVDIELTGADFYFVDSAWLHRPSSAHQIALDLPADRTGKFNLEIDTDTLRPGPYLLALSRIDGATTEVPVEILPPHPTLGRPVPWVNAGERAQKVMLNGTGLERIEKLDSDLADLSLGAVNDAGTQRELTVRLHSGTKAGTSIPLLAKIQSVPSAIRFPGALQVTDPRPRVIEAKLSLPGDLPIAPRDGEIPAGFWVSYAMKIEPADAQPTVSLQCAEADRTAQLEKLHVGERHASAQLVAASPGALFLALDPGAVGQSGCTLTATVETEALGKSDPFPLGKIVRLPRIESLALTDEKSADGFYGVLKGFDLETIEKAGWQASPGLAVTELPRPVAGEAAKQTLRIVMPWPSPSPKAPVYVWLRGESDGRATKVTP